MILVIGAAETLLLYCDVEPKEVPFDGEFEGTQLVAGECLGGTGSLRLRPAFSSSTTLVHVDAIVLPGGAPSGPALAYIDDFEACI